MVIRRWQRFLAVGMAVFAGLVAAKTLTHRPFLVIPVTATPNSLIADGYDTATLAIDVREGISPVVSSTVPVRGIKLTAPVWVDGKWHVTVRSGVLPGNLVLRVAADAYRSTTVRLPIEPSGTDRAGDGTPDFLRLDRRDEQVFRRNFAFLAEAQYFQDASSRLPEIKDCAALIRYAYREALREHDSAWADSIGLPLVPALPSLSRYQYPFTPLGPALFRSKAGTFHVSDLSDGTFLQFADAKTIRMFNTHPVSRDLKHAMPGDLIFFRQSTDHESFHSMIYLGRSSVQDNGNRYVVYHTGPRANDSGEIKRLTEEELMEFPQAEWRPLPSNPAFLGVARWNILRGRSNDVETR